MALHNTFGKEGEDLAAAYLQEQGYTIVDRNWRSGHLELDIVARKDREWIIVEVKTRRNTRYQEAVDAVDLKKIKRILKAADAYIRECNVEGYVRYDIITVVGTGDRPAIEHIEDAFQPLSVDWLS